MYENLTYTRIDLIKENSFAFTKARSRRYPTETITDTNLADDQAIFFANTRTAVSLLHNLEQTAGDIIFYVNVNKTVSVSFKQERAIFTFSGQFAYLGCNIS